MKIKYKHLHTSEFKVKHLGYGEWVEEADDVTFTYKGIDCRVSRTMKREPMKAEYFFGGHLCGYVCVPKEHVYYKKDYDDMDIDCHGGLTFAGGEENYWIGFDCAHADDYTPSSELLRKTNPEMIAFRNIFALSKGYEDLVLFNPVYRNIRFCIDECKSIVKQLLVIQKISQSQGDTAL